MADTSLSGLTASHAEALHKQLKVSYSAFIGIAVLAHPLLFAADPWF